MNGTVVHWFCLENQLIYPIMFFPKEMFVPSLHKFGRIVAIPQHNSFLVQVFHSARLVNSCQLQSLQLSIMFSSLLFD